MCGSKHAKRNLLDRKPASENRRNFRNPFGSQGTSQKDLRCYARTWTEPYVMYVQSALASCQQVQNKTSEPDNVNHTAKGTANDVFNLLVYRNCSTIDEIIRMHQCSEKMKVKSRHVTQQLVHLLWGHTATALCRKLGLEQREIEVTSRSARKASCYKPRPTV